MNGTRIEYQFLDSVNGGTSVSLNGLFKNALVELRFGQHFLETAVLNFKFLQPLDLVELHTSILFLPTQPRRFVIRDC